MDIDAFFDRIANWLLHQAPRVLLGVLILIVGMWLVQLAGRWIRRKIDQKDWDPTLEMFLSNLIVMGLRVLVVLLAIQVMGLQMTLFAALLGSFGVAAGLALSGTLQNFASGVLILMLKPFRVGDQVAAQAQEGEVTSIHLFYTVIRTADYRTVIVPNSKLSNEVIVNMSQAGRRRLDVELKVSYEVDFDEAKQALLRSLRGASEFMVSTEYLVGISVFEPDGYRIAVSVWVDEQAYPEIRFALQARLIDVVKSLR